MTNKPDLSLMTADSRGYVPDLSMLGTKYKHTGNGFVYTIVGFMWNGEDDTWMYHHIREGSPFGYLRTPANFYGYRSNGECRYVRVT